jgi:Thermolysin metallopeptidase, alpha-helical domain
LHGCPYLLRVGTGSHAAVSIDQKNNQNLTIFANSGTNGQNQDRRIILRNFGNSSQTAELPFSPNFNSIMKKILIIFLLLGSLVNHLFGQEITPSNCSNYNAFTKNGQIEQIKPLVDRALENGTLYLNPDKSDSLEFVFQRMGIDNGTTFEFVRETKSRLDSSKLFKIYQQFYNGLEVEGGGYTTAYIVPNGPNDPCAEAYMLAPHILTGISLNTNPTIPSSALPTILQTGNIHDYDLVISHNLNNQCELRLAWKVTYLDGISKISWIDAYTGSVIKTFNASMNHNAPTATYGNQFLTDLTMGNATTLQSPDSRIITYDFGNTCPTDPLVVNQWTNALIPSTNSPTEWTNESTSETYQAFWVTSQIIPLFDGIDIDFETVNVADCGEETAFSLRGSTMENAFVALGNLDGSTTAIFDVIAHELGHTYLNQFLNYTDINNATLHEGISDIIGTFIESLVPINQGVDWIMGDDEPNVANHPGVRRDLENPRFDCVTTAPNEQHERGLPLGHWYFLVSQGDQTAGIPAIGMNSALNILLESLNLIGRNSGYQELMQATLTTVQEQFGRCSNEFLAVARAWELICVPTGFANSSGVISPCYVSICGDIQVCEESEYLNVCACGAYPSGTIFRWTIVGQKSTEYESVYGMEGNHQFGGNCLTLIEFPKLPYYPQYITIKLYSPTLAGLGVQQYMAERRIRLIDCNSDDPTCAEYNDLQNNQSEERVNGDNPKLAENDLLHTKVRVFDSLGRVVYEGASSTFFDSKISFQGLAVLAFYNDSGEIVKVKKVFLAN